MNYDMAPTVVVMSVEIEIPNDLSDEQQDAIVDDLTTDSHLERLERLIKKWARFISGESCRVSIDVE
jgi:hypothetical protein